VSDSYTSLCSACNKAFLQLKESGIAPSMLCNVCKYGGQITPEKTAAAHDPVNHPSHYTSHPSGIECIDITRHHGFAVGNAIKYMWRAGLKGSSTENEIEDLKKAVWYLQDRIQQLELKDATR